MSVRRDEERLASDPEQQLGRACHESHLRLASAPVLDVPLLPRHHRHGGDHRALAGRDVAGPSGSAGRTGPTAPIAVPRLLVTETDTMLSSSIELKLLDLGPQPTVSLATTPTEVAVGLDTADVAILDATVPWLDVVPLCEETRSREGDCFILVVGLPPSEVDRVVLLDAGADDCLSRPCGAAELFARVRALVRRWRRWVGPRTLEGPIRLPDLQMLPQRRAVSVAGLTVGLSAREFGVLAALLDHPGQVLSRDALLDDVWGSRTPSGKAVDVVVARLRRKLTRARADARITTVRGTGFRLEAASRGA